MASLVFPIHDPDNRQFELLKKAVPILKKHFCRAFVSLTPATENDNKPFVTYVTTDPFFVPNNNPKDSPACSHFLNAFQNAVKLADDNEVLHLCALDRLVFAVMTDHQTAFLNDTKLTANVCPILFVRSPKAWATHPKNYYAIESALNQVGQILFGYRLDYAWCHLALTTNQLKPILPDLSGQAFFTQLLFPLRKRVNTKETDWLSWEDPFIFGKNQNELRRQRETDPTETEKRLTYVLPGIKHLLGEYAGNKHDLRTPFEHI